MNTAEKRIEIFKYVRDIPYSLMVGNPEDVKKERKGNCYAKSLYLRKLLEKEGYKARNITFPYKLRDFPDEVKYIPHQIDYHHALQIFLENQWLVIDPTYDIGLQGSDFYVNNWDGISSTPYCENPVGSIKYEGEENTEFENGYQEFCREIENAYKVCSIEIEKYTKLMEQYIQNIRKK